MPARLSCATVPGSRQGQQVESHSHRWPHRYNGPVAGVLGRRFCRSSVGAAGGASRDRSALGPASEQGFSVLQGRSADGRGLLSRPNIGGPISTETRINERIRVPEVRLIGPNGEQVGIVRIEDALRVAADADLDLVEVAPAAKPPVCKIMDYGKFKYETALKERESRKNQQQTVVKEQKLRPKIDDHDYETKKGHVVRFLEAGSKVKVTIMFRGREQSAPNSGTGCCSGSAPMSPNTASSRRRPSRTAAT